MEENSVVLFKIEDTENAIDSLKFLSCAYSSNASADNQYYDYVATGSYYTTSAEVSTLSVSDVIDSKTDLASFVCYLGDTKTTASFFQVAVDDSGQSGTLVELMRRFYRMSDLINHDVGILQTIVQSVQQFDENNKVK